MKITDHPDIQRIQKEVAAENHRLEQERLAAQMDAQQLRAAQGQYLNKQFLAAMEDYEHQRSVFHETVGRVWAAAQAYATLTGTNPPTFPEAQFNRIDVPTLRPGGPFEMSTAFTTTQAAVMGYFNSGRTWV